MKVTLSIEQIAEILIRHVATHRSALCVHDGFKVERLEWVQTKAGDPPAHVTIVIASKETP